MTYQVLARKYRPQKFTEVVGQDHITATLKNAISGGRLHHAYLFVGVRGTGKTTVARILAKALNCESKKSEEPCGECSSCKEIAGSSSMDVQEIDGASNTSVDDVRELRELIKYMPSSGKYKIYIIDEVHMLSNSAFNALLKTLEEPPKHVIFIFATTEAHKIPATILSRCQRYDFRRIPSSVIATTLKKIAETEKVSINDDALYLIAREATGSLRDAESLFDQAIAFSGSTVSVDTIKSMLGFLDRKKLFDLLEAVIDRDPKRALGVLDEVFETGADIVRFAMDVLDVLRHILVFSECGEAKGAVDLISDEEVLLKKLLKKTSSPELQQMFSVWYRVTEDVARSSFPKMLLEVGLIKLCRVGELKNIDEILARLDKESFQLSAVSPQSIQVPRSPVVNSQPAVIQRPKEEIKKIEVTKNVTASVNKEDHWQGFMRFIAAESPKYAAIFQSGVLVSLDERTVKMKFENAFHADMFLEDARKKEIEKLLNQFFGRAICLAVEKTAPTSKVNVAGERKKEFVREALQSDIVRQAADILNADVHEVKVGK